MKKSIRTHFELLFALLALAPIAIIFAIYSPGAIRELNSRAMEDLQSLGSSHVSIVSLWMKEKVGDTERIAVSHQVLAALKGLPQGQEELAGFLCSNLQEKDFLGIYVFDRNGNLKVSEERDGHIGPPKDIKRLLGKARKDTSFTWADSHEQEKAKDKRPALFVTTPVQDGTEIIGSVIVHLDIRKLKKVIVSLIGRREGCSFLVDREGRVLNCFMVDSSCPYEKIVGEKPVDPRTGDLTPAVKACLSGKGGFSLQAYTNHVGKQVLGTWEWLPELDMGIIVEIDAQEFFGPISMVKKRLWMFLLIAGIGLVIVSIFVGRRVSEPLISLSETAKKIAGGDLSERAMVKSQDELGELAENLNIMVESLQREHAALEEANEKLAAASVRDGLTGLYNHYRFQEIMDSEYQRARRYDLPLCLLVIDIDNFKLINDTYGHLFGDFVLKELAHVINTSIRDIDISSRYGGEEFTVILPNTELDGGNTVAEKLRQAVAEHVFKQGDHVAKLTVTIGMSSLAEGDINSKEDMVKHADEAMYDGKIKGKNKVVCWESIASKGEGEAPEQYRRRFMSTATSMKRSYMEAAATLVKSLEAKDGYSATHSYLVAAYAVKLAGELGLSREDTEIIKNSAILHDIGKIAVPSAIFTKKAALTEEERDILKAHAKQSVRIIEGIEFLQKELPVIRCHQEWFNGEGYPNGLKGTAIPLGTRILAICDSYEAMTSERPYQVRHSHKEAVKELRRGAGVRFDPDLVEPFIRAMEKLRAGTKYIYIPQLNKRVDLS